VKFLTRGEVTASLAGAARLTLCGGVALYLLGNVAFRWRMGGSPDSHKLLAAGALLLLYALGSSLPAWAIAAGATIIVAAVCAAETLGDLE
jgi:low temperature requirement protein LtrA